MKKSVVSILSLVVGLIFFASLIHSVQAAEGDEVLSGQEIAQGLRGFFGEVESFTAELIGVNPDDPNQDPAVWNGALTKIFFALLLFFVIKMSVDVMFGDKKWTSIFISLSITVIAFLAIPTEILVALSVQYGAMGAALLTVIPFIVITLFTIKADSELIARGVWVSFVVYYFLLFIYAWLTGEPKFSFQDLVYLIAVIAGIIAFFFIPAIRKIIFTETLKDIREKGERYADRKALTGQLNKDELEAYGATS